MARGNIYLVVPKARVNDPIPTKAKNTYKWEEQRKDENGVPVFDKDNTPVMDEVHPTWKQAAKKYKRKFGEAREIEYQGVKYILIEIELSFLSGQIDELIALKGNKVFPRYRLLTRSEARKFVKGELHASAETGN